MKKTLLFAFTSFILFSFTSNITAQSSAESEGTVENSLLPTKIEVPERKTSSKNRGLSSLFYSGESSELGPLFYNEYNAFATNVKESEGIIIYEYDDDEIALKVSKYLNMYLCFDRKARSAVRLGASFFRDDITSGALSSKNRNSYKAYGETTCHYKWGLVGDANETYPKTSVGYKYVKKTPYFVLTVWPAEGYAERLEDRDSAQSSEKMTFLFTEEQTEDLVAYFDAIDRTQQSQTTEE